GRRAPGPERLVRTQAGTRRGAGRGADVGGRPADRELVVALARHEEPLPDPDPDRPAVLVDPDEDPFGAPDVDPVGQERGGGSPGRDERRTVGRIRRRPGPQRLLRLRGRRRRREADDRERRAGQPAPVQRVWGIVGSVDDSGSSFTGAYVMSWRRAK